MTLHVGPLGAMNDITVNDGFLETQPEWKPKELETFEIDSERVLTLGGNGLNQNQYPVGIHNK